MFELPPIPTTLDALHPLIVHIPIGLLLIAPLFVVIGAAMRSKGHPYLIAAFLLMAIGTAATFVAVPSGEAAGRLVERTPEINAVLEDHEELAETTRLVFSILTLVFAGILLAPAFFPRTPDFVFSSALPLLFLLFYAFGAVVLINTGHHGGQLVHEFGVKAIVASASK